MGKTGKFRWLFYYDTQQLKHFSYLRICMISFSVSYSGQRTLRIRNGIRELSALLLKVLMQWMAAEELQCLIIAANLVQHFGYVVRSLEFLGSVPFLCFAILV